MTHTPYQTDVAIIGAGPVGLFAVFELGLYDMKAAVIDVLPMVGGQCAELYPEKPIYDIPALVSVTGQALTDQLMAQIKPFNPEFFLGQSAEKLVKTDDGWQITTSDNHIIQAKVVVIATGGGLFSPKKPALANLDAYEGTSVFYAVRNVEQFHNKNIVIAGGGDSALDWALYFVPLAKRVTLVHHRDGFKAAPDSVNKMRELVAMDKMDFEIAKLDTLEGDAPQITNVQIIDKATNTQKSIPADIFMAFYGLTMKAGPLAEFGINMENNLVPVDTEKFETNVASIFSIGDINTYAGKQKLILSGFHEAALMAKGAFHYVYPEKKFRFQYTTSSSNLQSKLGVDA
ncbi:MAG: thioredoxin reductase (NADPH) [Alphaproteobacteria bacterium]|jgi:thioredoxin reductase (NADPH)